MSAMMSRLGRWPLIFAVVMFCATTNGEGTEKSPRLIDRSPFDIITLKDKSVPPLEVFPLEVADDWTPSKAARGASLRIRLLEDATQLYDLPARDIAQVQRFPQLVINEAMAMVAAGEADAAYDWFLFLKQRYPRWPGLDVAYQDYLLADAQILLAAGKPESAWALVSEVTRTNPRHAKLEPVLADTIDALVERSLAEDDLRAARRWLDELKRWFSDNPKLAARRQFLLDDGQKLAAEARERADANDWGAAQALAWSALERISALDDARQILSDGASKYPRVIVAVAEPWQDARRVPLVADSERRVARLRERRLAEFVGPGSEGGQYLSPFGSFEQQDVGRRLVVQLKPDIPYEQERRLTGYVLSRRLVELATPRTRDYDARWARLVSGIEVEDVYDVAVELTAAHLRPEALLEVSPALPVADAWRPYDTFTRDDGANRFLLNEQYFAARSEQPREIVEIDRGDRDALTLLQVGRASVVDRLWPWEIAAMKANRELVVEPYAVPTVHCLLPNRRHRLTGDRTFRRALDYGIDRAFILQHEVLRRQRLDGCEVVSGPFPKGIGRDDPIRYAYNDTVAPRPYDPRLAMALSAPARRKDEKSATDPVRLVLGHPRDPVARIASLAIAKQLQRLGFEVERVEASASELIDEFDRYDLVYAELVVDEPLVDAATILGADGLTRGASPYVEQALNQLAAADSWKQAREELLHLHQLAFDDAAIIPLWQMPEFAAWHKSLTGVGRRPATLYSQVEQWRVAPRLPPEVR